MGRERVNTCAGVKTGKRSPRDGCLWAVCVCPAVTVLPGPAPGVAGEPKAAAAAAVAGKEGCCRSALTCGPGRGSAQHLPALIEGVIRFALKFSPLKRRKPERWQGLLAEEVSVHKMKGNFRGIYLPSWMV